MNLRDHHIHGVTAKPIDGRWPVKTTGWDFQILPPQMLAPCGGDGCKGGEGEVKIDFKTDTGGPRLQPISKLTRAFVEEKGRLMGWDAAQNPDFTAHVLKTVLDLARLTGTRVEGVYEP